MPKILPSARRNRALHSQQQHQHNHHHHQHAQHHDQHSAPPNSNILLTAPRKVSFEDGHQSSSSFCSTDSLPIASSSSFVAFNNNNSSSRSSLRRKPPSVCLVGLADGDDNASDCRSPRPPLNDAPAPSSPWGHFVDILVPLDEDSPRSCTATGQQHQPPQPLFGFFDVSSSNDEDEDICDDEEDEEGGYPTFAPRHHRRKHHRHGIPAPLSHPYGLMPRHHRRRRRQLRPRSSSGDSQQSLPSSQSSFLPGFFLEGPSSSVGAPAPAPTTTSMTLNDANAHESVESALQRLTV